MTNPMIIHGDVEALIIDILRNFTPELDEWNLTNISTDLRGYNSDSEMRWIMLTAEGGATSQWNVISKPRIDFEVRAELRSVAHDIAQIVFGSIFRAVPHTAAGATMTSVKTELGLVNVPDKEEEASYRYIFSLRLSCTADPNSAPGAQS